MRAVVLTFVLAAGLVACAGSLPRPTDLQAARWPGTSVADLERGRELYVNRCSACHALIEPRRFPAEKWDKMLGEMAPRARLGEGDREKVRRYLVSFARP